MRFLLALMLASCATVQTQPTPYEELQECPAFMTQSQFASGIVRCTALCSSWNRNYKQYHRDCRCECEPKTGVQMEFKTAAVFYSMPW